MCFIETHIDCGGEIVLLSLSRVRSPSAVSKACRIKIDFFFGVGYGIVKW